MSLVKRNIGIDISKQVVPQHRGLGVAKRSLRSSLRFLHQLWQFLKVWLNHRSSLSSHGHHSKWPLRLCHYGHSFCLVATNEYEAAEMLSGLHDSCCITLYAATESLSYLSGVMLSLELSAWDECLWRAACVATTVGTERCPPSEQCHVSVCSQCI